MQKGDWKEIGRKKAMDGRKKRALRAPVWKISENLENKNIFKEQTDKDLSVELPRCWETPA